MLNQKDNKTNFLGNVFLIVLFFIFIGSFSKQAEETHAKNYHIQQASEIHANTSALDEVHFHPFLSKHIASLDLSLIRSNTLLYTVLNFNTKLQQRYTFFKQKEQSIRPIIIKQFIFIGRNTTPELPPILS